MVEDVKRGLTVGEEEVEGANRKKSTGKLLQRLSSELGAVHLPTIAVMTGAPVIVLSRFPSGPTL